MHFYCSTMDELRMAKVLYLDDDTFRFWYRLCHDKGLS